MRSTQSTSPVMGARVIEAVPLSADRTPSPSQAFRAGLIPLPSNEGRGNYSTRRPAEQCFVELPIPAIDIGSKFDAVFG